MIDLQPFCARKGDRGGRQAFRQPFTLGDYSYATNAAILVRVPKRENVPPLDSHKSLTNDIAKLSAGSLPRCDGASAPLKITATSLLAGVPGNKCVACHGSGRILYCPGCNGEGEVECPHCEVESACKTCGGAGAKAFAPTEGADPGAAGDEECTNCDGLGVTGRRPEITQCRVGDYTWFDKRHLDAMAALPGLVVVVPGINDGLTGMAFRFDGGVGMVMPMRPPEDIARMKEEKAA